MVYATISDSPQYEHLHPRLAQALTHLTPAFLTQLQEGRQELDGEDLYVSCFSYQTIPAEQAVFEAHRTYADIHLVLDGEERVEIASVEKLHLTESLPQEDACLYNGAAEAFVNLHPGEFLVAFPNDAHKVKVQIAGPCAVRKAVFKVRL